MLNKHWEYITEYLNKNKYTPKDLKKNIKKDRLLGIFYDFYSSSNTQINSIVLILPTFEDLCLGKYVNGIIYYNKENIKIKDIRVLFEKDNNNFYLENENYILNSIYQEEYDNLVLNKENDEKVKNNVIEVLKKNFFYFNERNDELPVTISKKDFFKKITNTEERAFYSIIKEIGEEGNIVVSKLVEKNNISRPVYNNLINKMKENKIAIIENMGMKGIYVKITEPELRLESQNIIRS